MLRACYATTPWLTNGRLLPGPKLGFSLQTDGMGGKGLGSVEGRWELVQSQTTRRGH